jgi:hypothetical protein
MITIFYCFNLFSIVQWYCDILKQPCLCGFYKSFFGTNTWINELKLTMCLPWFIGYVYTEFQPAIWLGFELFTRPCSIYWKGRKRNEKSIVSKPTRFPFAKTKESINFPAPLLQETILQSVKIIQIKIGRFPELSATFEYGISAFKSAIDHRDCEKCVTKAVGNAAETGNEGQIYPH